MVSPGPVALGWEGMQGSQGSCLKSTGSKWLQSQLYLDTHSDQISLLCDCGERLENEKEVSGRLFFPP